MRSAVLWLFVLILVPSLVQANSDTEGCESSQRYERTFTSGAAWQVCVSIEPVVGLRLEELTYRAPDAHQRLVLDDLHLAQLLLHEVGGGTTQILLGQLLQNSWGLGGESALSPEPDCQGERLAVNLSDAAICSEYRLQPMLAKYASTTELTAHRWRLFMETQRGFARWRIGVDLAEDGSIAPFVLLLSYPPELRSEGLQILSSWRFVTRFDGEFPAAIEQYDFPLDTTGGNRRPMASRTIDTEAFAYVDRENFTAWRFSGEHGGYFLNPSSSGFDWSGTEGDWARTQLVVSVAKPCEQLAMFNQGCNEEEAADTSLDDHVDGEALVERPIALWHQQSRTVSGVSTAALPAYPLGFNLSPFDWSNSSPFESLAVSDTVFNFFHQAAQDPAQQLGSER